MSDKPEQTGRSWWRYAAVGVVLLVLYVFGVGPVEALAWKYSGNETLGAVVNAAYGPLIDACEAGDFGKPGDWLIQQWTYSWIGWINGDSLGNAVPPVAP